MVKNGEIVLSGEYLPEIKKWEETREIIYNFIYKKMNSSAETMFSSAMDFAATEGELGDDYFLMTDDEAFNYLGSKCNGRTKTLVKKVDQWNFYPRIFNFKKTKISQNLINYISNFNNRRKLVDEISSTLKISQENICVSMTKNKGFREIHLPISVNGINQKYQSSSKESYVVQAFLNPKEINKSEQVIELMEDKLKNIQSQNTA
jgi:hypothetical protein